MNERSISFLIQTKKNSLVGLMPFLHQAFRFKMLISDAILLMHLSIALDILINLLLKLKHSAVGGCPERLLSITLVHPILNLSTYA
jgi:hypothetical protein